MKGLARFRQGQPPRGPLHQAQAQALFKRRDATREDGAIAPQRQAGRGEAAMLDSGQESRDLLELGAVHIFKICRSDMKSSHINFA